MLCSVCDAEAKQILKHRMIAQQKRSNAQLKTSILKNALVLQHAPQPAAASAQLDEQSRLASLKRESLRLGETGWQHRYYARFNIDFDDKRSMQELCGAYIKGLSWVVAYYARGCASWQWFFPHHYAPAAQHLAQFVEFARFSSNLHIERPLMPFQQLMAVLPPQSASLIPRVFHTLMEGELHDYYPPAFEIDMEEAQQLWQGIPLLPFIDSQRLINAMKPLEPQLNEEEQQRNSFGRDELWFAAESEQLQLSAVLSNPRRVDDVGVFDYADVALPEDYRAKTLPASRGPETILTEYDMATDIEKGSATFRNSGLGVHPTAISMNSTPSLWPKVPESSPGYKILCRMGWTGGALGSRNYGTEATLAPIDVQVKGNAGGLAFDEDEARVKREQANERDGGVASFSVGSVQITHNEIKPILVKFMNENKGIHATLRFPTGLDNAQRAKIHRLCLKLGLQSISFGKDDERYITVSTGNVKVKPDDLLSLKSFIEIAYRTSLPPDERGTAQLPREYSRDWSGRGPLSLLRDVSVSSSCVC